LGPAFKKLTRKQIHDRFGCIGYDPNCRNCHAKFPKSAKQEFGSCWDRHTIRAETPAEMREAPNRP
jgi:hypothetical protein